MKIISLLVGLIASFSLFSTSAEAVTHHSFQCHRIHHRMVCTTPPPVTTPTPVPPTPVPPPVVNPPVSNPPPVTTPPPTPPPVTSSGTFGMNIGQEPLVNGQYDMSFEATTLAYLKAHGVTNVRTADYGTNSALSEGLALYAKNQGFYVQIGNDAGTLSPNTLSQYDNGVIAEAVWAQSNGIQEVSLGNEQESKLSGMSIAQWIAHVKSLATQVKAVYGGKVSYSINSDYLPDWVAAGSLGSLDALGLNAYCNYGCNQPRIQKAIDTWGVSHVEVTETNCDVPNVSQCQTDSGWATELQGDFNKLRTQYPTIPFYLFALQTGGDEKNTAFGVWGHPQVLQVLGI